MRVHPRQNLLAAVGALVAAGVVGLGPVAAAPAEIVVSSRVDKVRVSEEEPLAFSVTIAGPLKEMPRVTLPALKGFTVLSTGQSQQVNIRGGETQSAITLQYLLAPTGPGKYTLGPVLVTHEGAQYHTTPIEIEVTRAAGRPSSPAPRRPPIRGGTVL